MNKTQIIDQKSSTASDFEFSCKPLLGPSPELMQPQPSLKIVQESIVWRHHIKGACWRWIWEVLGQKSHSEAIFALAVPAWHRTVHRTVLHRLDGKIGKHNLKIHRLKQKYEPYCSHSTVLSDRLCTSLHLTLCIYRSSMYMVMADPIHMCN